MRVGLVVNPRAGRGRALARAQAAALEMEAAGAYCEVATTSRPEEAVVLARDMAANGCEVVFAAGGDGTINEVLRGILGTEAALGVVPAGLANVWAREVGLSAAEGAFGSLVREGLVFDTDIGLANSRPFLLMAGIGFDAEVVARVTAETKERWAQLAYVGQALAVCASWPASDAQLDVDGTELSLPLFGAVAANASNYGGIFELAPEGYLDDGLLELIVWQDGGFASRLRSMALAGASWRKRDGHARTMQARHLRLRTDAPLRVHADAELAGCTPCEIAVSPRAVRVLLPGDRRRRYLREGRRLNPRAATPARS